jgi:hypothetical protein
MQAYAPGGFAAEFGFFSLLPMLDRTFRSNNKFGGLRTNWWEVKRE